MKHKLTLLLALLFACSLHGAAATKPNILIIYVDDLGYGDVQCYTRAHHELEVLKNWKLRVSREVSSDLAGPLRFSRQASMAWRNLSKQS